MKLKPGDFYQDCTYQPVLCTSVDGDDINGISLVDGSTPRICSIKDCGIKKLTFAQAVDMKFNGPSDAEKAYLEAMIKRRLIPRRDKWWWK